MSISLPIGFQSPSNPDFTIQYVLFNSNAQSMLLYCYGAGGAARKATDFQHFISSHPSMSLLCIDRWTQGSCAARTGPALLSELSSITLELLDSLGISKLSIAAHSAGAYQMLDLAARAPVEMVVHVFPISTHIPAPFTASNAMSLMCSIPNFLFKPITKLDSSVGGFWADRLFVRLTGGHHADQNHVIYVDSNAPAGFMKQDKANENELAQDEERMDLDYRQGYNRIAGITIDLLTKYYVDCPVNVIWFTCDADVFFGPASVERIVKEMKNTEVEIIVIDGASHSDIFKRIEVWQTMYERMSK